MKMYYLKSQFFIISIYNDLNRAVNEGGRYMFI